MANIYKKNQILVFYFEHYFDRILTTENLCFQLNFNVHKKLPYVKMWNNIFYNYPDKGIHIKCLRYYNDLRKCSWPRGEKSKKVCVLVLDFCYLGPFLIYFILILIIFSSTWLNLKLHAHWHPVKSMQVELSFLHLELMYETNWSKANKQYAFKKTKQKTGKYYNKLLVETFLFGITVKWYKVWITDKFAAIM